MFNYIILFLTTLNQNFKIKIKIRYIPKNYRQTKNFCRENNF